jgi:glycerol-3-phosphate O-acyltransferase
LIRRVDWLKNEILAQDGQVAEFGSSTTAEVVDRALKVLKDLIGERRGLLEPVYYPLKRFELSYYRNQLIHLYIHEAIVACCMYSRMKRFSNLTSLDTSNPVKSVDKQELRSDVIFLSQLLKVEFIFHPGRMEDNFEKALSVLFARKILEPDDTEHPTRLRIPENQHQIARDSFDSFVFHCSFLWPFIETYWLAALSIYTMPAMTWVTEKNWMKRSQDLGRTLYYEGDLTYFESINRETLRNALDRLIEIDVLEKDVLDEGSGPIDAVRPTPTYAKCIIVENPNDLQMDALHELVENIGRFRREGRNRRDGANLNRRLLRLARLAAGPAAISKL